MATAYDVDRVIDNVWSDGTVIYEGNFRDVAVKDGEAIASRFRWYIGGGTATLYIAGTHVISLRPVDVHYEKVGDHTDLQVYIGVFLMFHLVLPPEMVE